MALIVQSAFSARAVMASARPTLNIGSHLATGAVALHVKASTTLPLVAERQAPVRRRRRRHVFVAAVRCQLTAATLVTSGRRRALTRVIDALILAIDQGQIQNRAILNTQGHGRSRQQWLYASGDDLHHVIRAGSP